MERFEGMRAFAGTLAVLGGATLLVTALWVLPNVVQEEESPDSLLHARLLYSRCIEAHRSVGAMHWERVTHRFRDLVAHPDFDLMVDVYAAPETTLRVVLVRVAPVFPDAPGLECSIDASDHSVLSATLWGDGSMANQEVRFAAYDSFDDWPAERGKFYQQPSVFRLVRVAERLSDPFSAMVHEVESQ